MISDRTINGVIVIYPETGEYEGAFCVRCFKEFYRAEVREAVSSGLLVTSGDAQGVQEWLDENDPADLATLRSLWCRKGLETWLRELVDKAFPHGFPAEPRISVELDWEEDCITCDGEGKVADIDSLDNSDKYCPDCDGIGVTVPRCDSCGEIL